MKTFLCELMITLLDFPFRERLFLEGSSSSSRSVWRVFGLHFDKVLDRDMLMLLGHWLCWKGVSRLSDLDGTGLEGSTTPFQEQDTLVIELTSDSIIVNTAMELTRNLKGGHWICSENQNRGDNVVEMQVKPQNWLMCWEAEPMDFLYSIEAGSVIVIYMK